MRLDNILKRQDPIHKDLERPVLKLRTSMLNQLIPQQLLIPLIATPQRTALEPHSLPDKRANINPSRQHGAPHLPQTDNAAIHRRRIQIALEIASADEIDDEIHALSIGRFQELRRPVLRAVVEAGCCAEFAHAEVDFLRRRRCHVDSSSAVRLRKLDTRDGDARGTGVEEDGFVSLELADEEEGLGCCYPGLMRASASEPYLTGI